MSRYNQPTDSPSTHKPESTIKRRAIPITIVFMIVFVLGFLFHYFFLADDAEDQVVGPTPDEELRRQ